MSQECRELVQHELFVASQLTLPYHDDLPPQPSKGALDIAVPPNVSGPFRLPEVLSCFWGSSIATAMSVPKTAVNEHDLSSARQHDIRRTWKIATMESKAIPSSEEHLADRNLGLRIFAADVSHQRASTIWAQPIHMIKVQSTFRPTALPVPASRLHAPPNQ